MEVGDLEIIEAVKPKVQNNSVFVLSDDEMDHIETEKYYCQELKVWIDMENSSEWSFINIKPEIKQIFEKLRDKFFSGAIKSQYQIFYDINQAISDGSAFKIFQSSNKILLSANILTRPRIQQMSVILHILVHIYLNEISSGSISINKHDENFRCIMHYLNEFLDTKITFSHTFMYKPGEEDYHKHWWICSGNCINYYPFKGCIRSTTVPNESMIFWKLHHEKCSGTFFKVFEIQRTNSIDEVEKKYIRSASYIFPKPSDFKENSKKDHTNIPKLPVLVKVDLTDDKSSPVVNNLCEVVDLDESQYSIDTSDAKYFEIFKKNINMNNFSCPFCLQNIQFSRLASHFDVCIGCTINIPYHKSLKIK